MITPDKTKLEHYLLKKLGKAVYDYKMIDNNDRILIGVSGDKDSLSLLRLLILKQRYLPLKYELVAAHVDFGTLATEEQKLEDFFKMCSVEYHIEKTALPEKKDKKLSNCFWCSWNRRKILFKLANNYNCNKIALAHHMDDIVETYLMNVFFHAEVSTMPPKISMFKGKLHIIRPLAYVDEKTMREYSVKTNLPVRNQECPYFTDNSQRRYIQKLIEHLQKKCPYIKKNLFHSMKNIKYGYLT